MASDSEDNCDHGFTFSQFVIANSQLDFAYSQFTTQECNQSAISHPFGLDASQPLIVGENTSQTSISSHGHLLVATPSQANTPSQNRVQFNEHGSLRETVAPSIAGVIRNRSPCSTNDIVIERPAKRCKIDIDYSTEDTSPTFPSQGSGPQDVAPTGQTCNSSQEIQTKMASIGLQSEQELTMVCSTKYTLMEGDGHKASEIELTINEDPVQEEGDEKEEANHMATTAMSIDERQTTPYRQSSQLPPAFLGSPEVFYTQVQHVNTQTTQQLRVHDEVYGSLMASQEIGDSQRKEGRDIQLSEFDRLLRLRRDRLRVEEDRERVYRLVMTLASLPSDMFDATKLTTLIRERDLRWLSSQAGFRIDTRRLKESETIQRAEIILRRAREGRLQAPPGCKESNVEAYHESKVGDGICPRKESNNVFAPSKLSTVLAIPSRYPWPDHWLRSISMKPLTLDVTAYLHALPCTISAIGFKQDEAAISSDSNEIGGSDKKEDPVKESIIAVQKSGLLLANELEEHKKASESMRRGLISGTVQGGWCLFPEHKEGQRSKERHSRIPKGKKRDQSEEKGDMCRICRVSQRLDKGDCISSKCLGDTVYFKTRDGVMHTLLLPPHTLHGGREDQNIPESMIMFSYDDTHEGASTLCSSNQTAPNPRLVYESTLDNQFPPGTLACVSMHANTCQNQHQALVDQREGHDYRIVLVVPMLPALDNIHYAHIHVAAVIALPSHPNNNNQSIQVDGLHVKYVPISTLARWIPNKHQSSHGHVSQHENDCIQNKSSSSPNLAVANIASLIQPPIEPRTTFTFLDLLTSVASPRFQLQHLIPWPRVNIQMELKRLSMEPPYPIYGGDYWCRRHCSWKEVVSENMRKQSQQACVSPAIESFLEVALRLSRLSPPNADEANHRQQQNHSSYLRGIIALLQRAITVLIAQRQSGEMSTRVSSETLRSVALEMGSVSLIEMEDTGYRGKLAYAFASISACIWIYALHTEYQG